MTADKAFQSTSPWLRLDLTILLRGIKLAMNWGATPRDEAGGLQWNPSNSK